MKKLNQKIIQNIYNLIILIICALFSGFLFADKNPSWFPKAPCEELWSEQIKIKDYSYHPDIYKSYKDYSKAINRKNCYKNWTVLIYMAADNDLTPYALWDIYEMEAHIEEGAFAGSTLKSDILIQLDTNKNSGSQRRHIFQSKKKIPQKLTREFIFELKEEEIYSPIVEVFSDVPEIKDHAIYLESFLKWGMREYPSLHYKVILWGHGQGWAPDFEVLNLYSRLDGPDQDIRKKNPFGGVLFDESQNTYLDIPTLKGILSRTKEDVLEGKPIDIYASDACLMQMIEVASEISHTARYIVGSAQIQDYLGLPYRELFYYLNKNLTQESQKAEKGEAYFLAKKIPDLFMESLSPKEEDKKNDLAFNAEAFATMSSLSSHELNYLLIPEIDRFSRIMSIYLKEDFLRKLKLFAVIKKTIQFQGGAKDFGVFLAHFYQDIMQEERMSFYKKNFSLSRSRGMLKKSIESLQEILNRTVINYAYGSKYRSQEEQLHTLGFRAFSVWIPSSEIEFTERVSDFKNSDFYRQTQWNLWLEELFAL